MFVKVFAGMLAGANAPQLISFASPASASLFVTGLIILAATRCLYALFGIMAGLILTGAAIDKLADDRLDDRYSGDSLVVSCSISGFPTDRNSGTRFDARCVGSVALPLRVRLAWYDPPVRLYPGDQWQFEVRLRRPGGLSNPGGFDVEKSAAIAGIGATGYVVTSIRNRLLASDASLLDRIRLRVAQRIEARLPHRDSAAIVVALAVGSRHLIDDAQWQRFSAAGLTHLIAISGLHIGLVATFGALLGRLLSGLARLPVNQRRIAILAAASSAVIYTAMSGFGVPAQRACLMLLIALSAWFAARETDGLQLLSVAGIVVMLLDPLASLSAGFHLSFLAVATLIWVARRRRLVQERSGLPMFRYARELGAVQIALFTALLAISAAHFGAFSLSAPVLNLIAVPLFSLVTVPLTLMALLVPAVDGATLSLAASSVEWLDALASRADVSVSLSATRSIAFVAGLGVGLWIVLPAGFPGRHLALACLLPLLLPAVERPEEGCIRTLFFDVGQGTSVLVETAAHRLLYDTGPAYRSGRSAADTALLPHFRSRGIAFVDRLIVSHADMDHAGGLASLKSVIRFDRTLAGEMLDGDDWSFCRRGQAWVWDRVRFEILSPGAGSSSEGNDRSCVLRISAGDVSVLLTGDIERSAERQLLTHPLAPITLLSVPHHGSRTSSTPGLVASLSPRFAVVSAGYRNRWGLPDKGVVKRWADSGASVLNTAIEGAIGFDLCDGKPVRVSKRHRRDTQKRWHRPLPEDPLAATENF